MMQWCKDQSSPMLSYYIYENQGVSTLKILSRVGKKKKKAYKEH